MKQSHRHRYPFTSAKQQNFRIRIQIHINVINVIIKLNNYIIKITQINCTHILYITLTTKTKSVFVSGCKCVYFCCTVKHFNSSLWAPSHFWNLVWTLEELQFVLLLSWLHVSVPGRNMKSADFRAECGFILWETCRSMNRSEFSVRIKQTSEKFKSSW